MVPLSPEVFQCLLAVAWMDGNLHPAEADAVLHAATDAGLGPAEIDRLRALAASPVTFADLDTDVMTPEQRLWVYGVASWVARADGEVTSSEQAALHAVATVLGVTGSGRRRVDELVDQLRAEGHDRLDLVGLRGRIDEAIRRVASE